MISADCFIVTPEVQKHLLCALQVDRLKPQAWIASRRPFILNFMCITVRRGMLWYWTCTLAVWGIERRTSSVRHLLVDFGLFSRTLRDPTLVHVPRGNCAVGWKIPCALVVFTCIWPQLWGLENSYEKAHMDHRKGT